MRIIERNESLPTIADFMVFVITVSVVWVNTRRCELLFLQIRAICFELEWYLNYSEHVVITAGIKWV